MAGPYSFFTNTRDSLNGIMAAGASSCVIRLAAFGTPSRKVLITIDGDKTSKRADFEATINGVNVTNMVLINGPDVQHDDNAVVWAGWVDDQAEEFQQAMLSGWRPMGVNGTYVSATTFTMAGDWTALVEKTDKIMLTNTTVKYFYIAATPTYSAGTGLTTFTVWGGIDYTLASAAITSVYFSKVGTPAGFPGYFNYTPTLYQSDGVTPLTGTLRIARCMFTGRTLIGQVNFDTVNSPGGPNLCFDTPVTVKGNAAYTVIAGAAWTNSNGTVATGQCMTTVGANAAKLKVLLPANGAWSAVASSNAFFAEFTIEVP